MGEGFGTLGDGEAARPAMSEEHMSDLWANVGENGQLPDCFDTSLAPPTLPGETLPLPDRLPSRPAWRPIASDEIPDLWPEDIAQTDSLVTPAMILRAQADLLRQKTKGLVQGRVIRERVGVADKIWLSFYLVAPTLDNCRCHLFRIEHNLDIYPLRLAPSVELPGHHDQKYVVIKDEASFLDTLREIFSAEKTRRLIKTLVTQSRALSAD
jgi:hypothetical protein